jgi:polysaccharide biosynthesis transport protein
MTENHNLPATHGNGHLPTQGNGRLPEFAGYGPEPGEEGDGGRAALKRALAAVRRYKWVVAGIALVGTSAAVFASRYVPLKYQAEATFWFDAANRDDQMRGPIQAAELLRNEGWIELLRSYRVLDYVVQHERLYLQHRARDGDVLASFEVDSMFRPGSYALRVSDDGASVELSTREGRSVEVAAAGEPVGRQLGFQWQPPRSALKPGREVRFTVLTPRETSRQLDSQMSTYLGRGASFLHLAYSAEDPEKAASVVNTLAERYVEVAGDLKRAKMTELRDTLRSQLASAQEDLTAAEMALESYRVQTITLPSEMAVPIAPGLEETRIPVLSAFFDLKVEQEMVQRERDAIRRILAGGLEDGVSVDALSGVGAVQQSPELKSALNALAEQRAELRALQQTYTDEHTLVQRAMTRVAELERQVVPELGGRLIDDLTARSRTLDNLIASSGGELRQIPTRAIEQARYRRSVASAENLYNDLRQRYEVARLAAETTTPDFRIMDRATAPTRPTADPRIQLLLMGLAGSLAIGTLLAMALDRADPRLRYVEQITDGMRLNVIGAVPNLGAKRRRLEPGDDDMTRAVEALRSIRLNLTYAYGSAGPMIVTISSPGSGDGKTFLTSNLALTYADLGMRTLVIDGDTRRGQVHRLYQIDRKPGLTDYLASGASADAVIRSTRFPLVDVIPGGTRRGDSPELLASPRLGDLLARIRADYDVILIDSPPLGAGVDPLILGTLSGNMMLVMRTGTTDRALAEAKLESLDRLPIRVLGVVINGMEDDHSYRYYSYLPGYEAGADDAADTEDQQDLLQPA